MRNLAMLSAVAVFAVFPCLAGNVLHTAEELHRYIDGESYAPVRFAITTTVTTATSPSKTIYGEDGNGAVMLPTMNNPLLKPGDIIMATGQLSFGRGRSVTYTNLVISVIGHVVPPKPTHLPLAKLDMHRHHNRYIETEGTVFEIIRDDIDDRFVFLLIKDGLVKYPVALLKGEDFSPLHYLEARIRVRGMFFRRPLGYRSYAGPCIATDEKPEILTPPPADPFAAPPIQTHYTITPREVSDLPRSSAVGHVLATWNGNRFLLRTPKGNMIIVQMLDGIPTPENGAAIKAVGYPTTDLFRINLTQAITKAEPEQKPLAAEEPKPVNMKELMLDDLRPTPDAIWFYHGRVIRYRGIVQDFPGRENSSAQLQLQTESITTTINAGASGLDLGAIPVGSEIEVTGVCVLEGENWTPERILPRLHGFMLVLRTASDLVVLRNPPWLTYGKLFAISALLLIGLLGVVLWNRHLNILVNRRGAELAQEKIKKESALLKTGERTRLAVELHDSLSQNLEGVACQVAATRNLMNDSRDAAQSCLDTAQRMLDSCRLELKRCLFDLRGHALEEISIADAVRKTLDPICNDIDLIVRFNVRRAQFDDTIVHATLCIIRELASNAIRHGHATQVFVDGEYHDNVLRFSVCDNGCGFNPADCAGPSQGHFGLAGIRERAERLDGTVDFASATGEGTRVVVELKIPTQEGSQKT